MLFDNLKAAVLSGDLNGSSSHISKEKKKTKKKKDKQNLQKSTVITDNFLFNAKKKYV